MSSTSVAEVLARTWLVGSIGAVAEIVINSVSREGPAAVSAPNFALSRQIRLIYVDRKRSRKEIKPMKRTNFGRTK